VAINLSVSPANQTEVVVYFECKALDPVNIGPQLVSCIIVYYTVQYSRV
jgi:hypothetical protein